MTTSIFMERAEQQGLLKFFKLVGKLNSRNMMYFNSDGKIKKYDS